MSGSDQLPVIDLRKARGAERTSQAKLLNYALETAGFFYLEGIDGYDEDELLYYTKWFFNLPLKSKMALARKRFNPEAEILYRGYFPVDATNSSHKEGIDYGVGSLIPPEFPEKTKDNVFYESFPWPETDDKEGLEKFKEFSVRFYHVMTSAGLTVLELAAEGAGAPTNFLSDLFHPDNVSTLRYLHYPPRGQDVPPTAIDPVDNAVLICSGHHDSGFVTMVSTFGSPGLELMRDDGRWMPVPCRPGAAVVNIGDMLASISGGKWRATNHRVIDIGEDRFSVPFFLEPTYTANMSVRLPGSDKPQPEPVSYGPWALTKMINSFYEFKDIPYPKSLVAD